MFEWDTDQEVLDESNRMAFLIFVLAIGEMRSVLPRKQ
jgi:hypothetical protein